MKDKTLGIIEIQDGENLRIFQGLFERPKIEFEDIDIPYTGTSTFIQKRPKWTKMELSFFDCCDDKDFKWLDEWVRLHTESIAGRIGYIQDYKKNINIKVFDLTNGIVTENWKLFGAFILNFETDFFDFYDEYSEIILNKLKRKVLFEKINHPTMQIFKKITINIDNVLLVNHPTLIG